MLTDVDRVTHLEHEFSGSSCLKCTPSCSTVRAAELLWSELVFWDLAVRSTWLYSPFKTPFVKRIPKETTRKCKGIVWCCSEMFRVFDCLHWSSLSSNPRCFSNLFKAFFVGWNEVVTWAQKVARSWWQLMLSFPSLWRAPWSQGHYFMLLQCYCNDMQWQIKHHKALPLILSTLSFHKSIQQTNLITVLSCKSMQILYRVSRNATVWCKEDNTSTVVLFNTIVM